MDQNVASWNHVTNWLRKVEVLLQLLPTQRGEPVELGVSIVLARPPLGLKHGRRRKIDQPARAGVGFVPAYSDAEHTRSKKEGDPWSIEAFHGARC
jgi:hypothetical protein